MAEIVGGLDGLPVEGASPVSESRACMTCGTLTPRAHYLVNGQRTCETCATQVPVDESTRLGRFSRALLLGVVAAAICAAIWYAVTTITGYELGLLALVVGLVVGVAVRLGSKERGGWVYQGMAVTLTYLAIVSTYVPTLAESFAQGMAEETAASAEVDAANEPGAVPPLTVAEASASPGMEQPTALLYAVAVPLAILSPIFLVLDDFAGSLIWLMIIGIALYEAWKVNQGNGSRVVAGPFDAS